jgi:hypothetical protein
MQAVGLALLKQGVSAKQLNSAAAEPLALLIFPPEAAFSSLPPEAGS